MKHKQHAVRFAAATFAAITAVSLTGCFANPLEQLGDQISEQVAKDGAEGIIENVTGGGVDIDFGEIPEGFPAEIPLVSETVVSGTTVDGDNGEKLIGLVVSDPRPLADVAEAVRSDFADWEEIAWGDVAGEIFSGQFAKGERTVLVGVMEGSDDEGTLVTYTAGHE